MKRIAKKLGIEIEGKKMSEIAKEVGEKALEDYGRAHSETLNFLKGVRDQKEGRGIRGARGSSKGNMA